MGGYVLRRAISVILVVLVVATGTFVLMHAIPGGPFKKEKALPPAVQRNIEERYKLNDPLWKQYTDYMSNLIRGDLGPSFKYLGRSVNDIIRDGFPVSATLGAWAILFALVVGVPAGIISALNQNRWQDNVVMAIAIIGVSVPNFVIATLLMYVFAVKLRWLPVAMWGTPRHVILPMIALAGFPAAFFARLMRSSTLDVLSQDYIRTARAKGLSWYAVVVKHVVKNAILPVVTYLGPLIAGILTGSFVVENIFAIPGLGRYYVTSIYNRDYTTIMGVTIFYSAFLVLLNFLVDIAYGWIDPRIKLVKAKE
ncbi:MAG TPA: ABC transporter permease [Bacillota bacterium]|nr:ABC transporter permease [Bacillota bacterium]HNU95083.1 ABC transporter permease [Bacillota bacterium]HOI37917.1 ABC transporter permease [Bacillota bacterium]HPU76246.1 ABC transporter permease [Bacillota bacterium]